MRRAIICTTLNNALADAESRVQKQQQQQQQRRRKLHHQQYSLVGRQRGLFDYHYYYYHYFVSFVFRIIVVITISVSYCNTTNNNKYEQGGCFVVALALSSALKMSTGSAGNTIRRGILITGATDRIGLTTAKNVGTKGYYYTDIIIHGRNPQRIERAKNSIEQQYQQADPPKIRVWTVPPADLSNLQDCRSLAQSVQLLCTQEQIDLSCIMNNAGVYAPDYIRTKDTGLEITFAVNVVSFFVVTSLLLPTLLQNNNNNNNVDSQQQYQRRIVIASSISQSRSIQSWEDLSYNNRRYNGHRSYSESKLLDAMLTMEFAERLQKDAKLSPAEITCNCLDPGTVNTKMLYAGWGPCGINVNDALDETWLCTSPDVASKTGRYFVHQYDTKASSTAYDPTERSKLWSLLSTLAPDAAEIWNFHWLQKL